MVTKKKKLSVIAICMTLVICLFAGCGAKGDKSAEKKDADSKKLKVVTTIFPAYDWTKNVMGKRAEDADITMLLDNGVDLHSYQPSAKDIAKISECDVFVYVGGESDGWVKDALKEATNKKMVVINLMDKLGNSVKNEEIKEGMEKGHHHHDHDDKDHDDKDHDHDKDHDDKDHDHDKDHDDKDHDHDKDHDDKDHDHDHERGDKPEKDEHVWLSVKNAKVCSAEIAKALQKVDPENKDEYKKNLKAYSDKLTALDKEYKKVVDSSKKKTLVFGDRFPFRYMVSDYNIDYFAAFVGCSAESEASFKTIKFLAEKVNELGLKHIMTIEKSDKKIAKTIIKNTKSKKQDVLTMDSMQSTTAKDVEGGADYLEIMKKNLDVLKKALN